MKNKIISICSNCNHIEIEHRTWKNTLKDIPKYALVCSIGLFAIIGLVGLYNFVSYGVYDDIDLMFQPAGGMWGLTQIFRSEMMTQEELQNFSDYVAPIIEGCEDDECKAEKIFDHLLKFDYEVGNDMNPSNIIQERKGDCDEMSIVFISLLKSINIYSGMKCNHNHCFVIVALPDKKIKADITWNIWEEK